MFARNNSKKIAYGFHCDTDQIYSHLNLICLKKTPYYKFAKAISEYFKINKNTRIIEISSGKIPILSSILNKHYNQVSALNECFLFPKYANIDLIQTKFDSTFDLTDYDLVVGYRPCSATENLINQCFKYKKSFAIYFCPCLSGQYEKKYENAKIWRESLIEKVLKNIDYECVLPIIEGMFDEMPVLFAKFKS